MVILQSNIKEMARYENARGYRIKKQTHTAFYSKIISSKRTSIGTQESSQLK